MSVPDSPEELLVLEAQTQQERSREVFTRLRHQLTRVEVLGTPDPPRRSFHVLPGAERYRMVFFEDCRQQPGGQVFSFAHVIVNDVTSTIDGDRRLDVNEFAVFGGHNAIVANKSTQRLSRNENTWVPADTTGPVLMGLDGSCHHDPLRATCQRVLLEMNERRRRRHRRAPG